MQSLEKRIAELEAASPAIDNTVMFLSFVDMGEVDKELYKLRDSWPGDKGQHWTREPGESEEAFKARASREVKRSPHRATLLYSFGD